jgi:BirA family biotin operon repressor/biotin-[acetyl-CoA-carboxylase] ligase
MIGVVHHTELDSTQDEAKRLLESGESPLPPFAIWADVQTRGRGSRGRTWESAQRGNCLVTYVFEIDARWLSPAQVVYPLSLGIYRFLSSLPATETALYLIKWPNDILLNGKKICGGLHEIFETGKRHYFLAGIGINVGWHPDKTHFPCTSLHENKISVPISHEFIETMGDFLQNEIIFWQNNGFEAVLTRIRPHLYHIGENITVHPARARQCELTGRFIDIDENGALLLKTGTGILKITAADIFPTLIKDGHKASS